MKNAQAVTLWATVGATVLGGLVSLQSGVIDLPSAFAGTTSAAGTSANPAAPGQIKKSATPAPKPTKSPTAEPPPKSLVLSPNPLTVSGLAPGVSLSRELTIRNTNNQDVVLQSVTASVLNPTPAPVGGLSCTSPDDFQVVLTDPGQVTIAKNSNRAIPVAILLNNSPTRNQDGCKGKTFSFTFSATATSK